MGFVTKIIQWVMVFLAGNLGVIQAGIKFVKELITLIIDILFPIIPIAKFQKVVLAIRAGIETADGWVEKIKAWLIPKAV
jgi:hypothetical protein